MATGDVDYREFVFPDNSWCPVGESIPAGADFSQALFIGDANFSDVTFSGDVTFAGVVFSRRAMFVEARFLGPADFAASHFQEDAHFYRAAFSGKADFSNVQFKRDANFTESRFEADLNSHGSEYCGGALFHGTTFEHAADFGESIFSARTVFSTKGRGSGFSATHETSLSSVVFEHPKDVYIDGVNLTMTRLVRTDLRSTNIVDVRWPKLGGRLCIYDEIAYGREDSRYWYDIELCYTRLKHHWEDQKNFDIAGHFHYGEKEMRRKARPLWRDPVLWLYWMSSGYGERALWACGWVAVLWLLLVLYSLDFNIFSGSVEYRNAANIGLRAITRQKIDETSFLFTIGGVLGPILIGLLGLAIRRRLQR